MTLGRTLVKSRASSGTQLLRVCLRCFSWLTEHLEKKSCSTCFRWLSVHFSNWGREEEGLSIQPKYQKLCKYCIFYMSYPLSKQISSLFKNLQKCLHLIIIILCYHITNSLSKKNKTLSQHAETAVLLVNKAEAHILYIGAPTWALESWWFRGVQVLSLVCIIVLGACGIFHWSSDVWDSAPA